MIVITFALCTYLALFDLNKEVICLLTILVCTSKQVRNYVHSTILACSVTFLRLSRKNHKTYGQCVFSIQCMFSVSMRKKRRSFRYIVGELTLQLQAEIRLYSCSVHCYRSLIKTGLWWQSRKFSNILLYEIPFRDLRVMTCNWRNTEMWKN
jgi:hypothetical protein